MSIRQKIRNLETEHSATGKLVAGSTPEALAYSARLLESDARKAEAICYAHPELDALQKIRSFLRRGMLGQANQLLSEIGSLGPSVDDVEVFLEFSRLALFSGKWAETIRYCDQALALSPSGVTQLTIRQICAVACYELRQFKRCRAELEIASSLIKLFPHASLALYVEATKIKLWIETGKLVEAESRLAQIWQTMLAGMDCNVDNCILLMRVELELRRKRQRPVGSIAFATWLATCAAGDDVYSALAIADIYLGAKTDVRLTWESEFQSSLARFTRLSAEGSSALNLNSTVKDSHFSFAPPDAENYQRLILIKSGVMIDLKTLSVKAFVVSPKVGLALRAMKDGKVGRESFFHSVWGQQKFSRDLHDGVIRRLIHRVRKDVPNLLISSADGCLELRGTLVVDV